MKSLLNRIFLVLALLVFSCFCAVREAVFVFTAETHCVFAPADTSTEAMGGMARRSTLIEKLRKEHPDLLLLDGGGAFAGGIYDEQTAGNSLDREKSLFYLQAMAALKYDCMAVGDEELAFGRELLQRASKKSGMRLVSANLPSMGGVAPHLLFKRAGLRIAVVGLTTQESFLSMNPEVRAENPFASLRSVLQKIKGKSDLIVVLSHLGEENSLALLDSFPEVHCVLNAHRKTSLRPYIKKGNRMLVNFSYQGRELYQVLLCPDEPRRNRFEAASVSTEVSKDPVFVRMEPQWIQLQKNTRAVMDLYVMSHCPYGTESENVFLSVLSSLEQKIQLKIYFILSEQKKGLSSLHGQAEIEEDLRQAVLQEFWPHVFFDYLQCANKNPGQWEACMRQMNIERRTFDPLSAATGESLLRNHFLRTERLNVHSSPTLFIRNRQYGGEMDRASLLREICASLPLSLPKICRDLPACSRDDDCRMPGKEGKCFDPGTSQSRCVFRDPEPFDLTVISDSTMIPLTNEAEILQNLVNHLPGAKVKRMDAAEEAGRRSLLRYDIRRIPAVILGKNAAQAPQFEKVAEALEERKDAWIISEESIRNFSLWKRKREKNQWIVFWSPLSEQGNEILGRIMALAGERKKAIEKILFLPIVRLGEENKMQAPGGTAELEEIGRQMALPREKWIAYLSARANHWQSSYWEEPLLAIGEKPDSIKAMSKTQEVQKAMERAARKLAELEPPEAPLFFLVDNRQIVIVRNEKELEAVVERMP